MNQPQPTASTSPRAFTPLPPVSCTTCAFHLLYAVAGGTLHLCTLPSECAPLSPISDDDADHWRDQEDRLSAYLGTSCDVMRRMGALCGPWGALWRTVNGH